MNKISNQKIVFDNKEEKNLLVSNINIRVLICISIAKMKTTLTITVHKYVILFVYNIKKYFRRQGFMKREKKTNLIILTKIYLAH